MGKLFLLMEFQVNIVKKAFSLRHYNGTVTSTSVEPFVGGHLDYSLGRETPVTVTVQRCKNA